MSNCPFCRKEMLVTTLPDSTPCQRETYEDSFCFAILAPEQYTSGHTLLILKEHRADITDEIPSDGLAAFIRAIHRVSTRLKEIAENDRGERPERIYVGILCDGVQHLHAHLIPRYPFSEQDKVVHKVLFSQRDGEQVIREAQQKGNMGGFWYIADREAHFKASDFKQKPSLEQARSLEELASKLRM